MKRFLVWASAVIFVGMPLGAMPAAAQALKGADTCKDEYKANKPALRAAKEKKGVFIAACRALPLGTPTPIAGAAPTSPAAPAGRTSDVGTFKTAGQCNDEYKQAKAALKAAKEKKKDFVIACRSLPPGTPTPVNGTVAAPASSAPAPAPTSSPAPAAAPAPTQRTQTPSKQTASPPGASACSNGYAHLPASHTAVQFCTDAEARGRCPGAPVVWVNTKSKVYHAAGSKTYGHTKEGAYMCESDATAEGDRAPLAHGH